MLAQGAATLETPGHRTVESAAKPSLIIASNRGPVEFDRDAEGRLTVRRGSGGVVTALTALSRSVDAVWLAAPMTPVDRAVARFSPTPPIAASRLGAAFRFVLVPEDVHELHYGTFCNPFLWFHQHGLWDLLRERSSLDHELREAWSKGYVPANALFAQAIAAELEARPEAPVLLQDYHLYLAAAGVRSRWESAHLQHFTHIPWPEPAAWQRLPWEITKGILTGLLANDVVSFQTRQAAFNFLDTCYNFVAGARVDFERREVTYDGRRVSVRHNPISIDVDAVRARAASAEVQRYRHRLQRYAGERIVVRVDRMDPAKDVLGGIEAYGLLLERHPGLRGRVRHLAFLVPSRSQVPEYRRYAEQVLRAIDDVNERFGRPGWRPIELFYEDNYDQALAGMSLYDVLVVNSVADGMNLVAKEGPVVNQRDGVLILSTAAGAYEELRDGCLPVPPRDVNALANAMWAALNTPLEARRRAIRRLRLAIAANDVRRWLNAQLREAA